MMRLAQIFPGVNHRYLKSHPELYKEGLLKNLQTSYKADEFPFAGRYALDNIPKSHSRVFANLSLPQNMTEVSIPNFLNYAPFVAEVAEFLKQVHEELKMELKDIRKTRKPSD